MPIFLLFGHRWFFWTFAAFSASSHNKSPNYLVQSPASTMLCFPNIHHDSVGDILLINQFRRFDTMDF